MNAAIFGNVSSIMLRLYRGTEEYYEKCHSIREFIRFYRVPSELAGRLIEAYTDPRCSSEGDEMLSVCSYAQKLLATMFLFYRKRPYLKDACLVGNNKISLKTIRAVELTR